VRELSARKKVRKSPSRGGKKFLLTTGRNNLKIATIINTGRMRAYE
jgi:hypothetical protein